MKKYYLLFSCLLCLSFVFTKAQTVLLNAVADNTIYSEFTDNSNGAGENFTSGVICTGFLRRGLLRFDFSSIPAGATIISASLQLTMNKTVFGSSNISLHRFTQNWGEGSSDAGAGADGKGVAATNGDATWVCAFANGAGGCTTSWTTSGGAFNATASATTPVDGVGSYTWSSASLFADVQNMLDNAASNFGWIVKTNDEIGTCSAKRFSSRTSSATTERPVLSVTYTTVTPITLAYFNARAKEFGSLLSWETLQETNTAFFELQHSINGQDFTRIGTVAAAGNSTTAKRYQYLHQDAAPGRNFYRMVQHDINGQRTISSIQQVDSENNSPRLLIAPNPVATRIILPGFNLQTSAKYRIISSEGKEVDNGVAKEVIELPAGLKPGLYRLLLLEENGKVRSASFLKQ